MKNIVYFDLETQKSAEEVGGWNNISRMGMSIGVTYNTAQGAYNDLIAKSRSARSSRSYSARTW